MPVSTTEREEKTDRAATTTGETAAEASEAAATAETTVAVKPTGHVRKAIGEPRLRFTFEGRTLIGSYEDTYQVRPNLA